MGSTSSSLMLIALLVLIAACQSAHGSPPPPLGDMSNSFSDMMNPGNEGVADVMAQRLVDQIKSGDTSTLSASGNVMHMLTSNVVGTGGGDSSKEKDMEALVKDVPEALRDRYKTVCKRVSDVLLSVAESSNEVSEFGPKLTDQNELMELAKKLMSGSVRMVPFMLAARALNTPADVDAALLDKIEGDIGEIEKDAAEFEALVDETLVKVEGSRAYKKRQKKLALGLGIGLSVAVLIIAIIAFVVYRKKKASASPATVMQNNHAVELNYSRV